MNEKQKYLRLRSPINGGIARATAEHLSAHAMILETGRKDTPRSTRARRHRVMVHALLRHLKMLPTSASPDAMTRPRSKTAPGPIRVALYDAAGAGGRGIPRLLTLLGHRRESVILPVGTPEIAAGALAGFDVVIFPGGSGSKQAAALGKTGRERVRGFVHRGGGYIGICAGAYLACEGFSWGLKILDARTVSRKWKRGSGTIKLELTDRGRAILGPKTGPFDCRYANGPIIKPAGAKGLPDYVPLAHFRTELAENGSPKGAMVDSPAICAGAFGKGRVITISPHPEQAESLRDLVLRAVSWAAGRD